MRAKRLPTSLWHTAVLAAVLGCFSLLLYVTIASSLARDVDKTLALQVEGATESLFAFWRAQRAEAGFGPGNWSDAPGDTFAIELEQGGALVSQWAEKTGQFNIRSMRLISSGGEVLAESPPLASWQLPLTEQALATSQRGHHLYETFWRKPEHIRLLTRPVFAGNRVLYTVQLATSLNERDVALLRLRIWLLALIPLTLLLVGTANWLITRMALGPISQMVARAQQFLSEQLHEQVDIPRTRDEFERLSIALSEMLTKLERSFRRLRQFSAAAAHEQRTALTVIKGEIGVTLRKPRKAEEYREMLERHLTAVNEIIGTTEQLLRLAQWEAVYETIDHRPVELGELARRMCGAFQPLADKKQVTVVCAADGPLWVDGEERLLERVLSNLVDNAIKYAPERSRVTVAVEPRGEDACLSVKDQGEGIEPSRIPELFSRFFKPNLSPDGTSSTGVGLGLCRWIVESHHGRIDVVSVPQAGTTFTVSLPLPSPRPPVA